MKKWIPMLLGVLFAAGLGIAGPSLSGGGSAGLPLSGGTLTGPLKVTAGALAATSVGPSGDDNTGINFPATDTINLVTSGALQWQVTSTGVLACGAAGHDICSSSTRVGTVYAANGDFSTNVSLGGFQDFTTGISIRSAGTTAISVSGSGINTQNGFFFQNGLGSSTGFAFLAGTLSLQSTPVSNSGTGETTLFTYDLPANGLVTTNRGVKISCYGSSANNANTKTLRVYFGTAMQTITIPAAVPGDWEVVSTIVRTGASAQRYASKTLVENDTTNATLTFINQGTLTQTETGAITIKVTGQSGTASNDLTSNLFEVDAI
jgi:hypothetical protein